MANRIYRPWAAAVMAGTANYDLDNNTTADGVYAVLVDSATYTFDKDHDFYNDVTAGVVGSEVRITTPTVTNGVFDGDNITFTSVSGNTCEAIVIFRKVNGGANTQFPLFCYIDTSVTGLPVTPNGGDITVSWNASGIVALVDQT